MQTQLPVKPRGRKIASVRALRVLQQRSEAIRARVRAAVSGQLGQDPSPAGLVDAAVCAHAALDNEGRRALARPGAPEPACSAGCSYCCHVHADASAPEILAVASHIRRAFSPAAQGELRRRLADQVSRVEHLSDEARWEAKIPCALLGDDGRCSIYEARPLRCRAFHSCSVAPCREAFHGHDEAEAEPSPPLERAHDAVEHGYDEALTAAGLSAEGYRLEVGLLVALEEPEAGARWVAGEPVFAKPPSP